MTWLDLPPRAAETAVAEWVATRGEPAYRTRQIVPRLWARPVAAWSDATDLPARLIDALDATQPIRRPELAAERRSRDGTTKFLWRFDPATEVESVLIPEGRRRTLCISSQAGCAFGCTFCATGAMGFGRHLAPWEIATQVRELTLRPSYGRPTHVVFMGMGEPLHNWDAVDVALSILNDAAGCGIGARHITLSTVGLVPGLARLAARGEQFRVALSLHSPIPERRATHMPVERRYPLPAVLEALRAFPRRVTFEYVLIRGWNDRDEDAEALAHHARALGAHVNLLRLHPGGVRALEPASPDRVAGFAQRLRAAGVNATVRRSRGLDIEAACGQLRVVVAQRGRVAAQQHRDVEQQSSVRAHDDGSGSQGAPHGDAGG